MATIVHLYMHHAIPQKNHEPDSDINFFRQRINPAFIESYKSLIQILTSILCYI
jgi:hypothetical protein